MNGQYLGANASFLYKGLNSRLRCFLKEISTFTLPYKFYQIKFLLYDRNHYRHFEISSVHFVWMFLMEKHITLSQFYYLFIHTS